MISVYFIVIGSVIVIGLMAFAIRNLLYKVEAYEILIEEYEKTIVSFQKYYDQILEAIKFSDIKLKQIDHRGTFESDDEVGYFFKMVKDLQTLLNSFDHTKPQILPPEELPKEPARVKK